MSTQHDIKFFYSTLIYVGKDISESITVNRGRWLIATLKLTGLP